MDKRWRPKNPHRCSGGATQVQRPAILGIDHKTEEEKASKQADRTTMKQMISWKEMSEKHTFGRRFNQQVALGALSGIIQRSERTAVDYQQRQQQQGPNSGISSSDPQRIGDKSIWVGERGGEGGV